ncbi:MAG: carbonic anhydrase family protein [Lautropia sp.]|nr:carbonic anhydrase family protein [Lautropia sp.]
MKTPAFSATLATLVLAFSAAGWAADDAHDSAHWSYEGTKAPAHWGKLSNDYVTCDRGKNQSPVDFSDSEPISGGKLSFHYPPLRYTAINNGHTVQAMPDGPEQFLTIGDQPFVFRQFHFHTPSEHTFQRRYFPMEVHFVHQGVNDGDALAVLGVVFEEGPENPALAPLLARQVLLGQTVRLNQPLDIEPLFPQDRQHFQLNGSLTSPPCSEGVHWIVFKKPVSASKAQIEQMRAMIGQANNRPVQPLNSRTILDRPH